jgi:hypothetical protein
LLSHSPPSAGLSDNGQVHSLEAEIQRGWQAMQNLTHAEAAYDTALTLARNHRLRREEVIVRRNLAALEALAGDQASALAQLQTAHTLCLAGNFNDLIWRVEHAIGVLGMIRPFPLNHALAQRSPLEWLQHAISILEALPEEPEGIEQRLIEIEEERALYDEAVTLLAASGTNGSHQLAALELAERSRANAFVNLAATRYLLPKKERQRLIWGGGGGLAADQRKTISRLQGELRKLEAEEPPRPRELSRVRTELLEAGREYQRIIALARAEDPELASFFSIQPVDVDSLRGALPPETAVLFYHVAADQTLIWLVSAHRASFRATECSHCPRNVASKRGGFAQRLDTTKRREHTPRERNEQAPACAAA